MAEGKLRQVELDAYRIQTRRFEDAEEERQRLIREQAVKGELEQATEDQLAKENEQNGNTQLIEGDVKVDTKELFKPEQHVKPTPGQQKAAAPVVQPVAVKTDEKKSEKKDTK